MNSEVSGAGEEEVLDLKKKTLDIIFLHIKAKG